MAHASGVVDFGMVLRRHMCVWSGSIAGGDTCIQEGTEIPNYSDTDQFKLAVNPNFHVNITPWYR